MNYLIKNKYQYKNKTKIIFIIICIVILLLNTNSYANISTFYEIPVWNENQGTTEVSASSENFLNIESESAILIEESTGKVLFEKNSHQKLHPASVTKIMTLLIIMEHIDEGKIALTYKVPCSENAASMGGSQIWLSTNETLTVDEMLKAICVVSANDCAVAMAEYIAGSEEAFVILMNEKAKALGMKDTTFKNCHGIDEEGHLTSSYDISIMSRLLLKNHPEIKDYTSIWMDSLRNNSSELVNTNKLIRTYDGATGLKTGSTSLALYNLSASATRDNLSLIAVVLRAPTTALRFSEAKLLLDYGFNKYSFKSLSEKDCIFQEVNILKGTKNTINLVFENSSGAVIQKTKENNIETVSLIDQNITAPINKGDILGRVDYKHNGEVLTSVNLIAEESIQKKSFNSFVSELMNIYFTFLK